MIGLNRRHHVMTSYSVCLIIIFFLNSSLQYIRFNSHRFISSYACRQRCVMWWQSAWNNNKKKRHLRKWMTFICHAHRIFISKMKSRTANPVRRVAYVWKAMEKACWDFPFLNIWFWDSRIGNVRVFDITFWSRNYPLLLYRLLYLSTCKFVACVNLGMPEIRALLFSDVVISHQSSILTQQNFN